MTSCGSWVLVTSDGGTFMDREVYGSLELWKPALTGEFKMVRNVRCTVVCPSVIRRVPGSFQDLREGLHDLDADVPLRAGDRVYVHYMALEPDDEARLASGEEQRSFVWEGQTYWRIPYSEVIAVERDGELVPLNGNVLVQPLRMVAVVLGVEHDVSMGIELGLCVGTSGSLTYDGGAVAPGMVIAWPRGVCAVHNFHGRGEKVRHLGVIGVEDVVAVVEGAEVDGDRVIVGKEALFHQKDVI